VSEAPAWRAMGPLSASTNQRARPRSPFHALSYLKCPVTAMFVFTAAQINMTHVLIDRDDIITVFRLLSSDMSIRTDQPTDTSSACKATLPRFIAPWSQSMNQQLWLDYNCQSTTHV
jgi:hypothetical protein